MSKRFETGKILVHMVRYGLPEKPGDGAKKTFWAKSYGESHVNRDDVVRVTIEHFTKTSGGMMNIGTVREEWVVSKTGWASSEMWDNDVMTYFERLP